MAVVSQKNRRKGGVMKIKMGKGNNEQEVFVRHDPARQRKERSRWSSREEFALEWNETFLTERRNPK